MSDKVKLIPPDLNQCQAETYPGSFMTLGPRSYKQCMNRPSVIVTEVKPDENGQKGSMSLCPDCLNEFHEEFGTKHATVIPIVPQEL